MTVANTPSEPIPDLVQLEGGQGEREQQGAKDCMEAEEVSAADVKVITNYF